jgi:hypothetical protein
LSSTHTFSIVIMPLSSSSSRILGELVGVLGVVDHIDHDQQIRRQVQGRSAITLQAPKPAMPGITVALAKPSLWRRLSNARCIGCDASGPTRR